MELQAPKQELHMSQTVRLATGLAPPVDRIRTPASACAVAARTVAAAAGTAAAGTVATGFRPLTVLECDLIWARPRASPWVVVLSVQWPSQIQIFLHNHLQIRPSNLNHL